MKAVRKKLDWAEEKLHPSEHWWNPGALKCVPWWNVPITCPHPSITHWVQMEQKSSETALCRQEFLWEKTAEEKVLAMCFYGYYKRLPYQTARRIRNPFDNALGTKCWNTVDITQSRCWDKGCHGNSWKILLKEVLDFDWTLQLILHFLVYSHWCWNPPQLQSTALESTSAKSGRQRVVVVLGVN